MVANFVQDGDADFVDQLAAGFTHVAQVVAEDQDAVGQNLVKTGIEGLFADGTADVKTEEIVGNILFAHELHGGAIDNFDENIFKVGLELGRDAVEGLLHGAVELGIGDGYHRSPLGARAGPVEPFANPRGV